MENETIYLLIERARNKRFNGKIIEFNQETRIAKLGRTYYQLGFSTHQPNKDKGDFTCVRHTVYTASDTGFTLWKNENSHGLHIDKYSIVRSEEEENQLQDNYGMPADSWAGGIADNH